MFEFIGKFVYIVLYFYWAWYLHGTNRARIIVVAEGCVLLVKPWLGLGAWDLPGGGANKDEDFTVAACRELFEETRVRVDPEKAELVEKREAKHGLIRFTAHYYFVPERAMTTPKPHRPEIAQARWISVEKLDSLKISPEVVGLIDLCRQR